MRQLPHKTISINILEADLKHASLLDAEVQAEGDVTGNTIHFPVTGFDALIYQQTHDVADSGTLAGKVQESDDDMDYTDLQAFSSMGADGHEQWKITITKPYLKYVGTAGGGGMGTIEATAGIVY